MVIFHGFLYVYQRVHVLGYQLHRNLAWKSAHGRCCCRQGKRHHLEKTGTAGGLLGFAWMFVTCFSQKIGIEWCWLKSTQVVLPSFSMQNIHSCLKVFEVESRNIWVTPLVSHSIPAFSFLSWIRRWGGTSEFSDTAIFASVLQFLSQLPQDPSGPKCKTQTPHHAAGGPPILLLATNRW